MFIIIKKNKLVFIMLLSIFLGSFVFLFKNSYNIIPIFRNEEYLQIVEEVFKCRNKALLDKDIKTMDNLYEKNTKYGMWAYEHELKKMKYLHKWSDKQGIKFKDIKTKIKVRYIKEREEGFSANFIASTEYKYVYDSDPETINIFRIGTYHSLNIEKKEDIWLITKEWYTDPFADSLHLDDIKSEEIKQYIKSSKKEEELDLNERRIGALEYADKYCGAAADEEYGFKYNNKYKDYNPLGGDCANFASQILHEGGKFRKTNAWNYDGNGSKAWVNAHAFKDYMIYSGRASVIGYGKYNDVYKASYKLLPGDFVAYEKNGKVTHISVISGADSKGYVLVNCHNTDRYRVPWDLGWSNKDIKFWLVRVHY